MKTNQIPDLRAALEKLASAKDTLFTPEVCLQLKRLLDAYPGWLEVLHRPLWEVGLDKFSAWNTLTKDEDSAWDEALAAASDKLKLDEVNALDHAAGGRAVKSEAAGFLCGMYVASSGILLLNRIVETVQKPQA